MGTNNRIKKNDTFFQWRKDIKHSAPILLKVIDKIEDVHEGLTIYKVKWHIFEKDNVYPSIFPMVAVDNEFYEFKPIPRIMYRQAMEMLKSDKDYAKARRKILETMIDAERL